MGDQEKKKAVIPFILLLRRGSYREEVGGRSRVLYHLTEKGRKALAEKEKKWRDFVGAVESVLRGQAECRTD